ncbi:MAG: tRNA (cytidine(34)-2'-O)-methyltransferase [Alphaproteobacteria bacterium]|nr:tRNA (cytidine(34)-2'-O)-methyltransferase [Alphaproteobacteria bacterium]
MRLALFQPDIPQNTGAALRLAACLGVGADVIEPCGFVWSPDRMRRSGMDYLDKVDLVRHVNWDAFLAAKRGRLLLLTTKGSVPYTAFAFAPDDILLLGRESVGAPPDVHAVADARLTIPMAPGLRSLNVVTAAAMVLGEALRQTGGFPAPSDDGPGETSA